ncbi:hypothetical protein AAFF_G00390680 [Aldrovandia affinis]|uniref:Reverse transcriptase n=1 Tax=Aldrovandia affinis TaxID=143900 RepID=A0AAD7R3Z2_9TELE|nr:hypothetical protein AAFF_G00390680 [Aldrovandia affinis]
MEPFAGLVCQDPGVDDVRLPGAAGVILKIQQYADDTMLFGLSVRSLGRIRPTFLGQERAPDVAQNWEARVGLVCSRLGVWSRWRLLLTGKVVVIRSVLLLLLLDLAYVFPVPAHAKLALMRAVFRFLWGGRYVRRELMYTPVAGVGGGVSRGYR